MIEARSRTAGRKRGATPEQLAGVGATARRARLQEDEWWRLGEVRTIAMRLRARILGLRCLAVPAGFSELNRQIARDVRQTALAGPLILHDQYPQDAGAVLGS